MPYAIKIIKHIRWRICEIAYLAFCQSPVSLLGIVSETGLLGHYKDASIFSTPKTRRKRGGRTERVVDRRQTLGHALACSEHELSGEERFGVTMPAFDAAQAQHRTERFISEPVLARL